ncbi:MAG: ferrous iron transport protein B [Oscillospiraceae bacterium]|nr:ferrous iron transport protein B [Oscillospiraceae bacterium]
MGNGHGGDFIIERDGEKVIALAGNPNVGKSTVFNALTGMKQHTGNWTGKTVQNAQGRCSRGGIDYVIVDIPGTYSLIPHSAEEEAARDFICFGSPDAVAVVCDATCLERNLNLALQIIEVTPKVVLCVNLMDEAEKKKIRIDTAKLSQMLGAAVCTASARDGDGIEQLMDLLPEAMEKQRDEKPCVVYPEEIEKALGKVTPILEKLSGGTLPCRWLALKLLENDENVASQLALFMGREIAENDELIDAVSAARIFLSGHGITEEKLSDIVTAAYVRRGEEIAEKCVTFEKENYYERDRRIDKVLTHRFWGVPIMILLLLGIFWVTVEGANYPSALLSKGLFALGDRLSNGLVFMGVPEWVRSMLIDGVYRVLAWVVSVMLPPMAIFFPLFTLLEDVGYLPRIAFNLDKGFKCAGTCGKQALTMAMGFGCNAVGVTGCRIIDSPRERLIAILTNAFVPCNGRFPTLIAIITMFLAAGGGLLQSFTGVAILTGVIVLGVLLTFAVSKLLSVTLLKGVPSSFTLELPPYRRPQFGKVIVRSILDRTVFVLGRAVAVAAPAGLVIWILGTVQIGDISLLMYCADFLEPFARFIGLDGVILLAFILGFPANEIVVPIMLMAYTASGTLVEYESLASLKSILVENGWTVSTAVCTMIFMLCHFPCSTTCLTVKKETGKFKWSFLAAVIPTAVGIILCALVNALL